MKKKIKKFLKRIFLKIFPELSPVFQSNIYWNTITSNVYNSNISEKSKLYQNYRISNSKIGDYTYIAENSIVSITEIGKFCSIGPNFLCGWGIHPTNGISTSPMFYSKIKQNGMTLSETNKVEERKQINIGNDVFIGANVTVLDGVTIGNGAVIGAGAVVSRDIPDFAIAVGCPIKIVKYRFTEEEREKLKQIKWWQFDEKKLKDIERYFFDVDMFIKNIIK